MNLCLIEQQFRACWGLPPTGIEGSNLRQLRRYLNRTQRTCQRYRQTFKRNHDRMTWCLLMTSFKHSCPHGSIHIMNWLLLMSKQGLESWQTAVDVIKNGIGRFLLENKSNIAFHTGSFNAFIDSIRRNVISAKKHWNAGNHVDSYLSVREMALQATWRHYQRCWTIEPTVARLSLWQFSADNWQHIFLRIYFS